MVLISWATHALQWLLQRAAKGRPGANLKKQSQSRLFSATREHEEGIGSNRKSACCGEYVIESCTHRPSRYGNYLSLKRRVHVLKM